MRTSIYFLLFIDSSGSGFSPPTDENHVITEVGDFVITETSSEVVTE